MRISSRWLSAALAAALGIVQAAAQTGGGGGAGGDTAFGPVRDPYNNPESADTVGVSSLEEQLSAAGEEDDIDSERETIANRARGDGWNVRWRMRVSSALQAPAGFLSGYYAGSRMKVYQRLEVREGKGIHLALLTEKDPGERNPADFVSGAVSVGDLPGGVRVVAGDFRLRAGQGLLFGSARSFGKGPAVIEPVLRDAWGIPAGLSSDEVNFFRGAAVTAGSGAVAAILFGSIRSLSPLVSPGGELRGIDRSGYHRTATELGRAGLLTDRSAGGLLRIRAGAPLSAGISLLRSSIEPRWSAAGGPPTPPSVRVRGSADLQVGAGPVSLFGEVVFSAPRPPWIAGMLIASPGGLRTVIVRRSYPPSDEIDRTFGFGDGSAGRNETGLYMAVEAPVVRWLVASGYLDILSSPAPPPGALFPPAVRDRVLSFRTVTRGFGIDAGYRSRTVDGDRTAGIGDGPIMSGDGARRTDRMKCVVRWEAGGGVSCRLRIERSVVSPGARGPIDYGITGSAELTARSSGGMTVQARMELFGAPSDLSGFTSVEADLPGMLSATALSGDGSNWYLLWSWRLSRHLGISLKYSRFRRDDVRRIGSGAGELPSSIREKAGVQLDLLW